MKDLENKVFLITGANSGIGQVTAETLANRGAIVVLACRSQTRAQGIIDTIEKKHGEKKVHFITLDLASLESVREASDKFKELNLPLHGLINNAGVAGAKGLTEEGFEMAFGVNHLGHFLLTLLLIPNLKASSPSRIVNVASTGHYRSEGLDWEKVRQKTATKTGFPEYCDSKLANILFTSSLSKRLENSGITTYSLHPGEVASDIWRHLPGPVSWVLKKFMMSNEEGAQTTLFCATSEEAGKQSGLYYHKDQKVKKPSRLARDEALAENLWQKSLEWTDLSDFNDL